MSGLCLTGRSSSLLRDVERAYAVGEKITALKTVFGGGEIDPGKVFRWHLLDPNDVVTGNDLIWREQLDRSPPPAAAFRPVENSAMV